MKNPLRKRLPKELKSEMGKYIVIFLFLAATIGFISGFLVADGSMLAAYNESFTKYNIEDGNFETGDKINDETIKKIEKDGKVTLYNNYYTEEKTKIKSNESTLRIFNIRDDVNKACLMKGKFPESKDEIAVDRMYADNNKISVGDIITCGDKKLKITGLVALSDYSALFSDNSDMMFDAVKFGTAVMTKEGAEEFYDKSRVHYNYSWKYDKKPADDIDEKKMSDDFTKVVNRNVVLNGYTPAFLNQAIHFTGNDMGGDKSMMLTLLYILIAIMAFVFAITTSNTIVNESSVIGTLRASGYTKGEMVRHYMTMPLIVCVISCIVGNILGYTVFKNIAAGLYYGSYSLPTYKTIWNGNAFVLTTVVPLIIMMLINFVILVNKLSLSPLKFIRRDLKKNQRAKAIRLPNFKFMSRFRLRVIGQNIPGYIMLLIGIGFANILLLFGMMLSPLINNYQESILNNMISNHQYVLKMPVATKTDCAEKFCMTSLKTTVENRKAEDISIYGISDNSKYIKADLPDDGVYISGGFAEKYDIKTGDSITLKEQYEDKRYSFKVKGIYDYPAALSVFMPRKQYNIIFNNDKNFFNGYFSDKKITDIDEKIIYSDITKDDLTKVTRQLKVSMGDMFHMVNVFSVVLYMLIVYLLCKLIIEKNSTSISMLKILGYENREISRLYMMSNTIVVVASTLVTLPIAGAVMKAIYKNVMYEYSGWLPLYIEPKVYLEMAIMGIIAYLVVALIENRKIGKIPMVDALKNVE
ncbi:ABC transporter permease [Inconstantimicrobium porci]|uniref:ABC transporter permease n=1 Tax=Inconstantimicrobium porci TaxID=2652291 RepID=UPI00240A35C7|nr:ABC transporter permease [Inconstantimicrobium porci]MDD6769454.1 FtsX-like permease family protein [Inconstantimicrobium porci]